jgi:NADPH:quinone reductase-like Zn-dependent oxidoreductase
MTYPENLDWVHAAAVPLVFQTAWHMLVNRAQLQVGEDVLVLAAGSGVGSAALQVAKFFGARVIATAGTDEKLKKAKELGADELINHSVIPISKEVRRLTNNRGVDIVFEHVGSATWEHSIKSLAPGGRLVTCGATTGYDVKLDMRFLFTRQLSLLGSYMGTKTELRTVLKLVEQGRLKPAVDKVWPLQDAALAHDYLEKNKQFGKVVLTIP